MSAIILVMADVKTGRDFELAALDLAAVGRRIVMARVAAGLTPTALAAAAGLSTSTIGNWETGANRPRVDQLGRILPILRVTSDFVFYGVDAGLSWEVKEAISKAYGARADEDKVAAPPPRRQRKEAVK